MRGTQLGGDDAEPSSTPSEPTSEKLRVFLSYSRKDTEFIRHLANALAERGYLADFDQTTHHSETGNIGIAPTDDWWMRLQDMIAAADVMVLSVSPDSAASSVVDEEIAYARSLSKRVIAITCKEVDFAKAPPRLSALNVNHWFLSRPFDDALNQLCSALDRDVEWLRTSSRYTVEAKAWADHARPDDRLLFGEEIAAAESWSARRPATAPEIADIILDFFTASRAAQAEREERDKRQIKRTRSLQRWIGIAVATALVITMAGAWFVINGQRDLSRSQSLMLARASQQFFADGDYVRALRLALLASRDSFLTPSSPDADLSLVSADQVLKLKASFTGHTDAVLGARFANDGSTILSWSEDGTARRWKTATGEQIGEPIKPEFGLQGVIFSKDDVRMLLWGSSGWGYWSLADGKPVGHGVSKEALKGVRLSMDESRLLAWDENGGIELFDASNGKPAGPEIKSGEAVTGAALSPDNVRLLTWNGGYTARLWDAVAATPLGTELQHDGIVTGAEFSADGSRVLIWANEAFISDDTQATLSAVARQSTRDPGEAKVWSVPERVQIGPALVHGENMVGAMFSRDGQIIMTWGKDGLACFWDASTGQPIPPAAARQPIAFENAAYSRDGGMLLSWNPGGPSGILGGVPLVASELAARFDFDRIERKWPWKKPTYQLSADSRFNFAKPVEKKNTAQVWFNEADFPPAYVISHEDDIIGAAFSPNGDAALTWGADHMLRLWAVEREVWPGDMPSKTILGYDATNVDGLKLSPDESRAGTWGDNSAYLWNMSDGAPIGIPMQHDAQINGLAFSPDGKQVLTWGEDGFARMWDAATGALIGAPMGLPKEKYSSALAAKFSNVIAAEFSSDGALIMTLNEDHSLQIWNAKTTSPVGPDHYHTLANGAYFSADGKRVLMWGGIDPPQIWDSITGAPIGKSIDYKPNLDGVLLFKDGRRMLTWNGPDTFDTTANQSWSVRLWDVDSGTEIGTGIKPPEDIEAVLLSPDESLILTLGEKVARLWDVDTGKQHGPEIVQGVGISGAAFSPDGSRVLAWSTQVAVQWDVGTGKQVGPVLDQNESLFGAKYSADGRRIVTWGGEINIAALIWDSSTGTQLGSPIEHALPIDEAWFTADQKRLVMFTSAIPARVVPIETLTTTARSADLAAAACELKLQGGDAQARRFAATASETGWINLVDARGKPVLQSPRRLDDKDIAVAPILRGREGEDICGWSPPWYDGVLQVALGWAFQ